MKLLVFNPEHDLALAANLSNFTAPHAGAERRFLRLMRRPFSRFIDKDQIRRYDFTAVDVWGWDLAIRASLLRWGVDAGLMPTVAQIDAIRQLSHRRYAMQFVVMPCSC